MLNWITKLYLNKDQRKNEKNIPRPIINAISISDVSGDEWIRVIPIGSFPHHPYGDHEITSDHIQQMAANFKANSKDLLFDYDHGSVFRSDSKAAGWSTDVEAREDGLYAKFPAFTSSAEQSIDDREYRYLSPVYFLNSQDKLGREIGATIHSVALTNTPYMDDEIEHIGNSAALSGKEPESTNKKKTVMNLSKENLAKLGLEEDATEEQINKAIANSEFAPEGETVTTTKTPEKTKETPKVEAQTTEEEEDRITILEKKLAEREKADKQKEQKDLADKAELMVNSAVKDGKILPRDKDAYFNSAKADYDKTKGILDGIKVNSVTPGSIQVGDPGKNNNGNAKVNSTQAAVDYLTPRIAASKKD